MRIFVMAVSLIAVSLWLLSVLDGEKYADWGQRLKVEIQTPNGVVVGTGVARVSVVKRHSYWGRWRARNIFKNDGLPISSYSHFGEAVPIHLGDGRIVLALLTGDGWGDSDLRALVTFPGKQPLDKIWGRTLGGPTPADDPTFPVDGIENAVLDEPRPLPERAMPTFELFNNPASQSSGKTFKSTQFASVVGGGYSLRSITLEITNAEADMGRIRKQLPRLTGKSQWGDSRRRIFCFNSPNVCPENWRIHD